MVTAALLFPTLDIVSGYTLPKRQSMLLSTLCLRALSDSLTESFLCHVVICEFVCRMTCPISYGRGSQENVHYEKILEQSGIEPRPLN